MRNPERDHFMQLVETARSYCNLIDRVQGRNDWLTHLFRILPRLHAEVVALHYRGEGTMPPELADFDDRFALFTQLRSWLGERDRYWLEYDQPTDALSDDEHRTGSLADDLTDIYFDLMHGLQLLDEAWPQRAAEVWQMTYRMHWGQHLVDAERHLYALKVRNQLRVN